MTEWHQGQDEWEHLTTCEQFGKGGQSQRRATKLEVKTKQNTRVGGTNTEGM